MAFDPDAYLKSTEPKTPAFDPDAYLAGKTTTDQSVASDIGKLFGAGAIGSIAGAPEAVQSATSGMTRETAFMPTEALNLIAQPQSLTNKLIGAIGLPPIFKEEKKLVPESVIKEQKAELDKVLTKGKIQSLQNITEAGGEIAKQIEGSISPDMKIAMAASQPTGNIIEALDTGDFSKISLGKDPSVLGLSGQFAKVFGSTAPIIATSLITKSVAPAAGVGFGQAASEGVSDAKEYIRNMSDAELSKNSEYFRNLMLLGYDAKTARSMTEDKAADTAALYQGTVGALGGAFTGSLVTGKLDKALLSGARNKATRILQGTVAGAAEEGLQELAEGLATDLGIDKTVARQMGADSFANVVLGAIGGGGPGGVRGAIAPSATAPSAPAVTPQVMPVAAPNEPMPTPPSLSQDTAAMIAEIEQAVSPEKTAPVLPSEAKAEAPVAPVKTAAPEIAPVVPVNAPITPLSSTKEPEVTAKPVPEMKSATFAERIKNPDVQESLKRYAQEAGWQQRGGLMIREVADDYSSPVVGRTQWLPNSDWWLTRPVSLRGDMDGSATRKAINKAYRGERLGKNEKQMVEFLIGMHDFDMTEGERQRAELEQRDREAAEFNKQFETPLTQEQAAATQADQQARIKAEEDAAVEADMAAQAERDRAEIARRSAEQAQGFALGQTPEESLTGQQRLAGQDDDIPFFSMERPNAKPYTRQVANNERVLNEKIAELTSINIKRAAIHRRLAKDKLKPLDQFEAKNLYEKAKEIEDDIESLKWATRNLTAEKFMARATAALAAEEISRDVYDTVNDIFKKNPNLLEGLRLQIKQGSEGDGNTNFQTAGEFIGRIVRLYKGTSGTEDPSIIRHELTHSLEQVMSKDAKKKLVQEWRNKLDKAAKTEKTPEGKTFFDALFEHLKNPTRESFGAASNQMPVGKKEYYYQFMSPSEYWAVNAEKLLAANLGGAWAKFKNFVRGLFESLKNLFGFDNNSTIHKVFNEVITGKREGTTMLTDLQRGVIPNRAIDVGLNEAFKKWFGDSKVVNEDGSPKVVYHGTPYGGFSTFDKSKIGTRDTFESSRAGFYFSETPRYAGLMSRSENETGPSIYPVYLSIKNPLKVFTTEITDKNKVNKMIADAKSGNHDGIIDEMGNFVVFNPNQIKSAIGNIGAFSASEPSITMAMELKKPKARNIEGQVVSPVWNSPEVTKIDNIIYKLQDKNIDTKRVIQAIQKETGDLEDKWNVYLKEELYHGRTSSALRKFMLQKLLPTVKEMNRLGISPADMNEYLHNRHAEERNDQIAKIRPAKLPDGSPNPAAMTDGGSGLTYKQIENYFDKLNPAKAQKLEQVAKHFDDMIRSAQKVMVDSGQETQGTIDTWNETYDHYVPLFREDDDFASHPSQGTGKGFATSGSASKRAMGSTKGVQDIMANILGQYERSLIKAEKVRVGHALYGLAIKNPNPNFWLPVNPDAIKDFEALAAELDFMGLDGADVAGMMQEIKKPEIVTDKKTGLQTVRYKINPLERYKDNVFPVRVNGKDRYIFFNQNDPRAKRMVEAMKNLDTEQLGAVLGFFGKLTRWFSAVNTQYNPVFGGINLLRDVQGAAINLSSTKLSGEQAKVLSGVMPSMRTIFKTLKAERNGLPIPNTDDAKLWEEFKEAGGQTLYRDSLTRKAEEKQLIEHELDRMKRGPMRKAFTGAVQLLSDFNDTIENAVRLSAYKVAVTPKDKGGAGLSKEQAASIAKNLTVNFDRKGQLGSRINALYAFFNAAVQGSARLYETMKGPAGRKIFAGGVALGAIQAIALAAAGFDEDEPPEFIKERNLIIPLGGKQYAMIPMPLGLHFFPNIGRITAEWAINDFKKPGEHLVNLFGTAMDAFNPLGSSGLSMQTLAPSVADPLLALEANKDAFGRPIYKKDQATNPTPGYLRSREGATEISKLLSEFLNYASGGTKYQKGLISPTGDEIDYLAGQFTGGVGREVMKVEQAIASQVTGEELAPYKVPIAGRFIGDAESKAADAQRFYQNVTKMADFENEIKGRQKSREDVSGFLRDNPQARLWMLANTAENQISQLNKQRKELLEKGAPKERIKQIENQKQVIMRRFNDKYKSLEQ